MTFLLGGSASAALRLLPETFYSTAPFLVCPTWDRQRTERPCGLRLLRNLVSHRKRTGLGYDIFRGTEDGGAMWVGDASALDQANQKLRTFFATKPGAYFVRDVTTGQIVSTEVREELGGEYA